MNSFGNRLLREAKHRKEEGLPRDSWYSTLKGGFSSIASGTWKIMRDTPTLMTLITGMGIGSGAWYGFKHEQIRERQIPLAFSEYRQIQKESEKRDREFGPVNFFYASDNDMRMKIFEAWNNSWKVNSKNNYESFAREIQKIMKNENKKFYYNLSDLLTLVPKASDNALHKLERFTSILPEVSQINSSLDSAWEDTHSDNYHNEVEMSTDSDGNVKFNTKSVYDNTDHTYTFYPEQEINAVKNLNALAEKIPFMKWPEQLLFAAKTNPEGNDAIKNSRPIKKKGEYSGKELRDIAMTWNTGSIYSINQSDIIGSYNLLIGCNSELNASLETAMSTTYRTSSRADAGPKEFQVNERALNHGSSLEKSLTPVIEGMHRSRQDALRLKDLADKYVSALLNPEADNFEQKINPDKVQKEIMSITREGYKINFPAGLDIQGFRAGYVFLYGFIGLLAGGLLGLGVDRGKSFFNQKRRW